MSSIKIITYYLPQFHIIEENSKWWGKDFTDWVNVKKATPLFEGHNQPRIPLNNNYYNLLEPDVLRWQVGLANKYGIYGFCFHHYWFDGKLLLEKPMEIFLNDKECNLHFCICWANEAWTNQWISAENKILINQSYGDKSKWREHYEYLRRFLKDERYICEDGKPLILIYRPELIDCRNEMLEYWNDLALRDGFEGLKYAYVYKTYDRLKGQSEMIFDYAIEYQPTYAMFDKYNNNNSVFVEMLKKTKMRMKIYLEKKFGYIFKTSNKNNGLKIKKYDYDEIWNNIIAHNPSSEKYIPGAFVDWDNSPRKGERGTCMINVSPEKFEKYMRIQIKRAEEVYKKDMIFLFAWNEWAEGGYLEPDNKNGYAYLEAIKNALSK